jgi:hypothetical protein
LLSSPQQYGRQVKLILLIVSGEEEHQEIDEEPEMDFDIGRIEFSRHRL